MKKMTLMVLSLLFIPTACSLSDSISSSNYSTSYSSDHRTSTDKLYESFFSDDGVNVAQLNLFATRMPKGGDLHHHYSGSIYAETYVDWVKRQGKFIDRNTFRVQDSQTASSITVDELRSDSGLYRKLLTLWSDMDYGNHFHYQPPPDLNFFNTFGYFGSTSTVAVGEGLQILKGRAIKENVSYIETMIAAVPYSYQDDGTDKKLLSANSSAEIFSILDEQVKQMQASANLEEQVSRFISNLDTQHQNIDSADFMMRYQSYASRNSAPSRVFASLYAAFLATSRSDLLVGVNIVGPENGVVALKDYSLHMQMFAYLKEKYPNVNRALHAGELTLGMVPPEELNFHIEQALDIAGAQRIGHGVDLPYEENSLEILEKIQQQSVVEINLTSNQFILGVQGRSHPYLIYSAAGVPLIISTDDSGVSRNNLSNEYVLLASRYKPSYSQLKDYVYNSIKYSFMTAQQKTHWQNDLDLRFDKFEQEMSAYYGNN